MDPDLHNFGNRDPDPHQGDKPDLDPHQIKSGSESGSDLHQSDKSDRDQRQGIRKNRGCINGTIYFCRKHCWSLETVPEEAAVLGQIWQLFQSEPFFLLLSNLTGLRLHSLAPEDRSGFELRISAPGYESIAHGFPGYGMVIFS